MQLDSQQRSSLLIIFCCGREGWVWILQLDSQQRTSLLIIFCCGAEGWVWILHLDSKQRSSLLIIFCCGAKGLVWILHQLLVNVVIADYILLLCRSWRRGRKRPRPCLTQLSQRHPAFLLILLVLSQLNFTRVLTCIFFNNLLVLSLNYTYCTIFQNIQFFIFYDGDQFC